MYIHTPTHTYVHIYAQTHRTIVGLWRAAGVIEPDAAHTYIMCCEQEAVEIAPVAAAAGSMLGAIDDLYISILLFQVFRTSEIHTTTLLILYYFTTYYYSVFPPARRSKYTWTSDDKECLTELADSAVRAELSEECTFLLVFHSEALRYGKYVWTVTAQEDCCIRVGIVSREMAGEPYSFDPVDKEDGVHWSWYLESEETGANLCKSFKDDDDAQESDFYFGKNGDVLKVHLDCRSGELAFEVRRGDEVCHFEFGADPALARSQGGFGRTPSAPGRTPSAEGSQASVAGESAGDSKEGEKQEGAAPKPSAVSGEEGEGGRRMYAFIELLGNPGDAVVVSKIMHESRIPTGIRTFFKNLSDNLQDSRIVRPIPESEISYKGGKIEINGRCWGSKTLDQSATSVIIHWPRTALPGPTKMEVRICPPPPDSEECCAARYTSGLDKLHSGHMVGLVVDLRPHGLQFNVPITIQIPHSVLNDPHELWQSQLEGLKLDDFRPVMDVPNCLFTCIDGKFDKKYGLLTVKTSGIYGLKASDFCRDVVHAKLYCEPSRTFLDARTRLAPHLRGPEIDKKMHEITSENFPEVFVEDANGVPMVIKVCGVFCQDELFKEVLKAPIYHLPYRSRIITLSINQKGYALGMELGLSKINHSATTHKMLNTTTQGVTDLYINTIYLGGPVEIHFAMTVTLARGSELVLNHPALQIQEVEVSLKLRGNISRQLDQTTEAQLQHLIKQKRLQQHVSFIPFPVHVRKLGPKAHLQAAAKHVMVEDRVVNFFSIAGGGRGEGLKRLTSAKAGLGPQAVAADLYVIRSLYASPEVRSLEARVLDAIKRTGWTVLDLSAPLVQGSGLRWKELGKVKPTSGFEIANAGLAAALLQHRLCFTQEDLNKLHVSGVSLESYIKITTVGSHYFQPLTDRDELTEAEYSQALLCKATLVFVDSEMLLKARLDPHEPLAQMWRSALEAHGLVAEHQFGGDGIIPVSLTQIATGRTGVFPDDTSAWIGQVGERLKSFSHNLVAWDASEPLNKIHEWLLGKIKAGPHGLSAERADFFRAQDPQNDKTKKDALPSVKHVCERVLAIAREVALDGQVDLQMSVKHYFQRHSADPFEFWMSLENEFALEIREEDIERIQAFFAVVRIVHVRVCKAAGTVSPIRDGRPSLKWLEME